MKAHQLNPIEPNAVARLVMAAIMMAPRETGGVISSRLSAGGEDRCHHG
jgi:hypothetical protein